jgi:hypothetical protein
LRLYLFAEDDEYQRVTINAADDELMIEGGVTFLNEDINGYTFYHINPHISMGYVFDQRHTIDLNLPYNIGLYNSSDSTAGVYYTFGDINISYAYLRRQSGLNLSYGGRVVIPFAKLSTNTPLEGNTTGNEQYYLGASFSIAGVLDPVVWRMGINYDIGLPESKLLYTSWQPGNSQIYGQFTRLINERFGLAFTMIEDIRLPEVNNGIWERSNLITSNIVRIELFVLYDKDDFRLGVDMYTYPNNRPIAIKVSYGHRFTVKFPSK